MLSKNFIKRSLIRWVQSSKLIRKQSVWSADNVISSPYRDVEIPNSTLYEYVWKNLERWPERTMAVCATTGRGYTYEQGFKLSNTFAANLRRKFQVRDGDVVAVMLPNVPDYPLVTMGILEAGGIITSINPIYTAHEVQRQLVLSEAKIVVTLPETVAIIKEACKMAKIDLPIITIKTNGEVTPEGTVLFNDLTEDVHVDKSCLREVRRSASDVCFLPYSSGTTGLPKGVELTHRNLIANCEQVNEPLIACHNETTETHQDKVLVVLPLFHIYSASVLMFHKMAQGAKLVTVKKFTPEDYFKAIEGYKTNLLFVAPPLMFLMASHPAATEKSLRYIEVLVSGAAPLSASDTHRFFEKANKKIDFRQGYGLTETSPTISLTPKGYSKNYDATGPPIPSTRLRIVDNDLNNIGPNQTGEILVHGPQVMRGYKNNPRANEEVFTADGWFRTGDLGHVDEEGTLTIADRLKELIKVCGVTNRAYTFEELYKCSRTLGANLRKKFKLRDGDVIAILLPNVPEYPVSVFGVLAAGGIVTTINPIYTPYEIQRQLDTSGAKIVITLPDLVPNVKKSLELSKKDLKIIAVNIDSQQPEGTISFKELTEDKHIDFEILKEVKRVSDDIAFMVYSSGTTGLPKAVELTHTNKVANFSQQDTELRQYEYTTETNQDSTLGLLPLFHTYGLSIVMMHKLSVGLKLVTLPSFQPRTFLDALLKHPMELMYLAPPTSNIDCIPKRY